MNARLVIGLFGLLLISSGGDANGKKPPVVEVAQPIVRVLTDYETAQGRVEAVEHIDLRARVTGYVAKVGFRPGDTVKQGDVLFELDDRPYRAALETADARLAIAAAHVNLAKAELDRASQLLPKKAISLEDFDRCKANQIEAKDKLIVAVAEQQHAKLNLDYTRIRTPINGVIGEPKVTAGNLAKADDTLMASIDSAGPVHVGFQLDERSALRVRRLLKEGNVPVAMGRADDAGYPHQGVVDFTDNRVDPKTDTIRCRAIFVNGDGAFLPGMRVSLRVPASAPYQALLVSPQGLNLIERSLLVVNNKNVVERREVEIKEHDGLYIVKSGLKAADWVIVKGACDVGMTVQPKQVVLPGPGIAPPKKLTEKKAPVEGHPDSADLKMLLKERHAVLAKAADLVRAMHGFGGTPFPAVVEAERAVIEAGLEMCETRADRLVLLRKNVELAGVLYKQAQTRLKVDRDGSTTALQAQALLLDAQIRLLREELAKTNTGKEK